MKKNFLKSTFVSAIAAILLLTGCGAGGETKETSGNTTIEGVPERFAKGEQPKIKVIRKIGGDDHTAQFLAGAKQVRNSIKR